MIRELETTDACRSKQTTAARNLSSWVKTELSRLAEERRLFRAHLSGEQLRKALEENRAEQSRLDRGWKNSSLRRRIEERAQLAETRSVIAAAPTMVSARRDTSESVTLAGYAAVFNSLSQDLGGFKEKIQRGAFANVLRGDPDVLALFHHDYANVLGRTRSYTLELSEDSHGLRFSMSVSTADGLGAAVIERVSRRDITGMSFGFVIGREIWDLAMTPADTDVRTITEIAMLAEISITAIPAYLATSVEAVGSRSLNPSSDDDWTLTDAERAAHDREADAAEEQALQSRIEKQYRLAGYRAVRNRAWVACHKR